MSSWDDVDEYLHGRIFRGKPHHCVICGGTNNLLIHHIDGNHENNNIGNLVVLCKKHHSKAGNSSDKLKEYDLRKDRGFEK